MVPRIKILGMFAREDGELVADLIELPVHCEFENKVFFFYNFIFLTDNLSAFYKDVHQVYSILQYELEVLIHHPPFLTSSRCLCNLTAQLLLLEMLLKCS